MGVSRSMEEFAVRMRLRASGLGKQAELAVRRAAVAADQAVVLGTPVDTGRARSNWLTTIGAPSSASTTNTDPSGAGALGQGRAIIEGWKLGMAPIFITNNVVYIMRLEQGWSAQAPEGMTRAAIRAAREELKKVRLLRDNL